MAFFVPAGGGLGLPNPSALPNLAAQNPDNTAYNALSMSTRAAGYSYADPVTGVTIYKVTDDTTPTTNVSAIPGYFESGPRISHKWGADKYTIDVCSRDSGGNGNHYLADFDYAAGTLTNWRAAPAGTAETGSGFSLKAATPQVMFKIQSGVLRKWDTSTSPATEITTGGFPKDLSANLNGSTRFEWLGFGIDERWFVMMNSTKNRVVAYDASTNTVLVKSSTDYGFALDEPKMERNGRYVWLRSGANSSRWWDLDTDTFGSISLDSANNYKGHAGTPRGYVAGTQSDSETAQWYAAPPTADPTVVNAADSLTRDLGCAGQWVTQSPADATQYVLITGNDAGDYGGGPVLLQKALGLCRINGSDRRLLCHHYSAGNSHTTDPYYKGPAWGSMSPDGRLAMFKSSMNSNSGRADTFLAKVPLA